MPSEQSVKDSRTRWKYSVIAKSLFTGNNENYKMNLKVMGVHLVLGNGWTTKKTKQTVNNNNKYVYMCIVRKTGFNHHNNKSLILNPALSIVNLMLGF